MKHAETDKIDVILESKKAKQLIKSCQNRKIQRTNELSVIFDRVFKFKNDEQREEVFNQLIEKIINEKTW